jgi:hypothetical protein
MPSKLTFSTDDFSCHIRCDRCTHIKPNGERCKNRVCFGSPVCWIHTRQTYGVQIKKTAVMGKGLFATEDIPANTWICPYNGETINKACLDNRYPGDMTAPYAYQKNRDSFEDAACLRGTGSMSNGKFRANGQSRALSQHNSKIVNRRNGVGPWLKSTKAISNGSEIYTYYGPDYRIEDNHDTKRTNQADTRPC